MSRWILPVAATAFLVGCSEKELPGQYWDISVVGAENECTGNGTSFNDSFEYRVELDGNDAVIAVGEDVFALGTIDGCTLSYTSLVWTSHPDGFEVKWQIEGDAQVNVGGGGGCLEQNDWEGTETYVINASSHPDVAPGCLYQLAVTGSWLREVLP